MESNRDFARTLALLRRQAHLSQHRAAADLGVSQALLSHYERGLREPGLTFVRRAADYYRVSADYLLGRSMSKDGTVVTAEALYDASAEKGNVVRGSVAALMGKKLLMNATALLFDLLGETGDKKAVLAATAYLEDAVYPLFRELYAASGEEDERFFSLEGEDYDADTPLADAILVRRDYQKALSALRREKGAEGFPKMDQDAVREGHPAAVTSLLQVIHAVEERIK